MDGLDADEEPRSRVVQLVRRGCEATNQVNTPFRPQIYSHSIVAGGLLVIS